MKANLTKQYIAINYLRQKEKEKLISSARKLCSLEIKKPDQLLICKSLRCCWSRRLSAAAAAAASTD